ncbi:methylenetetrahydrofolate reductase [NAD(P)H] [Pinisolibacter aquiterrae]|uniref:methylenetetrahydrofolate reductase [NAD(P)H] n=1 Tax=Pinisolibacter aquiterrae TaxID=2815579 RepID=UPI001C3CB21A|nr:methylenetetrahydrofolate reductase [NAD(P)H] [Pinisolibacter aquiterrae]MBV5263323.1 methylenetetrahydrofolate reductase [NAD(P)H] [Pinisolibacter aquiterrae]MCC8237599.1 methylenetetrahydrofolate reductase [NAD(P)H] [Pinisolibacter aquiterrae]
MTASSPSRPSISFEFFPPKTEKMEAALWRAIEALAPLAPSFVSVTYGAGGSTRERTHDTVARIVRETTLKPAAHLTCVSATRAEVDEVIRAYAAAGVGHIVALRGDPPEGVGEAYRPHPGGYAYASDLVAGIAAIGGFEISVGAYPERHPESADWATEIDNLKRKVDAGASRAITQFFFDDDLFEDFLERVRAAGISIPIVPGIIPIHNFSAVAGFAEKTGASVPRSVGERFGRVGDTPEERAQAAIDFGIEQVADLRARGVEDFHFYTMNRADLVTRIVEALGIWSPETLA